MFCQSLFGFSLIQLQNGFSAILVIVGFLMCEAIPDLDFEHIKHMPSYECLNCQSCSAQDVSKHVDHQIEHLQMEKHSLDVEILALSDICKKYSQDQESSMGDSENFF